VEAPKISIFSTPLVSTWVFDDTHRILFDAGDGVSAMLDARVHRIRSVAITHAHRDHCSGLLQLLNLTGESGTMSVLYPEGSGALRALSTFLSGFDSRSTGKVRWQPVNTDSRIAIEPERHFIRCFATDHYPKQNPPRHLSLGYQIVRHVDKLRPEFRELPREQLDALRLEHGRAYITQTVEDVLLSITGDTMPLDPECIAGSRALLHECTFLDIEESRDMAKRGHPHSALDDVLRTALEAHVQYLGLYHISRRYDDNTILQTVRERAEAAQMPCAVSVALPGRVYDDLFAVRVWDGQSSMTP
jgi:ribonuclease Z